MDWKQLISESNGQLSSARVSMYFGLILAAGLSINSVLRGTVTNDLALIISWLTIPTGFKTIQKFAEK